MAAKIVYILTNDPDEPDSGVWWVKHDPATGEDTKLTDDEAEELWLDTAKEAGFLAIEHDTLMDMIEACEKEDDMATAEPENEPQYYVIRREDGYFMYYDKANDRVVARHKVGATRYISKQEADTAIRQWNEYRADAPAIKGYSFKVEPITTK